MIAEVVYDRLRALLPNETFYIADAPDTKTSSATVGIITEYAGQSNDRLPLDMHRVQILVRGEKYPAVAGLLKKIKLLLQASDEWTNGLTRVYGVYLISLFDYLGKDDKNRTLASINFEFHVELLGTDRGNRVY